MWILFPAILCGFYFLQGYVGSGAVASKACRHRTRQAMLPAPNMLSASCSTVLNAVLNAVSKTGLSLCEVDEDAQGGCRKAILAQKFDEK
jgi:hypothetical protein